MSAFPLSPSLAPFATPRVAISMRNGQIIQLPAHFCSETNVVIGGVPMEKAKEFLKDEHYLPVPVPMPGFESFAVGALWLMDYKSSSIKESPESSGSYREVVFVLMVSPASPRQDFPSCFQLPQPPTAENLWHGSGYGFAVKLWLDTELPITMGREVWGIPKQQKLCRFDIQHNEGFKFSCYDGEDLIVEFKHGEFPAPAIPSMLATPQLVTPRDLYPTVLPHLVDPGTFAVHQLPTSPFTCEVGEKTPMKALGFTPMMFLKAPHYQALLGAAVPSNHKIL